jgi:hypothetical protein
MELVLTSQETYHMSIATTNRIILFSEAVAVYCENHAGHTNTPNGQNAKLRYVKAGGSYRYRCAVLSSRNAHVGHHK